MAKSKKPKKRKHGGGPPATDQSAAALTALDGIVVTLQGEATSPSVWGDAQHALFKTKADRQQVMQIIMTRDLDALTRLVDELAGRAPASDSTTEEAAPPFPARTFEHDLLKRAMRAYRKRLKLTRLDDESRLSVSPMTGGKHSQIRSILPPHEFDREVWEELARQGQLRDIGQGFFELAAEPPVRD